MMVPHVFYFALLMGMVENALGSRQLGVRWRILYLTLPLLAWTLAVTWIYHRPLQDAMLQFQNPMLLQSLSTFLMLISGVLLVQPLLETRHRWVWFQQCLRWGTLLCLAVAPLSAYPVAATLYPELVSFGVAGMAALGVLTLALLGWLFSILARRMLDPMQSKALRPFLLFILSLYLQNLSQ